MKEILTDEQVKVLVSICPKCKSYIRIAIKHLMTAQSKRQFMNEVLEHDLEVKTTLLTDYRNSGISFCKCKKKYGKNISQ